MKKIYNLLLLGLFLVPSLLSAQISYTVGKVATAPVIDGNGSDAIWSDIPSVDVATVFKGSADSYYDGTIKMVYDDTNLYLFVNMPDDVLANTEVDCLDKYWMNDCIEPFFDMDNIKNDTLTAQGVLDDGVYQYRFVYNAPDFDPCEAPPMTGIVDAYAATGLGWSAEIKFPWATLKTNTPSFSVTAGSAIGFELKCVDQDELTIPAGSWAEDFSAIIGTSLGDAELKARANWGTLTLGTLVGLDETAPAAVSDLFAYSPTETTLDLIYTAPGDDGASGGAATIYDVRYSTSTISDGNFAAATAVSNAPTPAAPGAMEMFTVSGLTAGTTYYFAVKTTDDQSNVSAISNVSSAQTTSTVQLVTDDPETSNVSFCEGDAVTLTATGNGTIKWYAADQATLLHTGASYVTTVGATTLFFVSAQEQGKDESGKVQVAANMNALPNAVATLVQDVITASPAGGTYIWYQDGGVMNGQAGISITVSVTGLYSVQVTTTGCAATSAAVQYTATVIGQSNPPSVNNATPSYCQGDVILAVTASGEANGVFNWYSDIGLNSSLAVNQANYTPAGAGTIYVTQTVAPDTESNPTAVTVSINPVPTVSIAENTPGTLTATASAANSHQWYMNGGIMASETSSFLNPPVAGSYTVTVESNGCSATSAAYSYTVAVGTPDAPVVSPTTYNMTWNAITAITATGEAGATIKWYSDPALQSLVYTGVSFTPPNTLFAAYYATQTTAGGTSVSTNPIIVNITQATAPAAPTFNVPNSNFDEGDAIVLTAVPAGSNVIKWYSDQTLTSLLYTGTVYSPVGLTAGNHRFYASQTDASLPVGSQESAGAAISIIVWAVTVDPPVKPTLLATVVAVTLGDVVTLMVLDGTSIQWYSDAGLTTLLGSGDSFLPTITASGVFFFYATQTDATSGLESAGTEVMVTVADVTTGTQEDLDKLVMVYPNPTTGTLNVVVGSQEATVVVADAVGQIVATAQGSGVVSFDIEAAGLYIVTVTVDGASSTLKVIKE